MREVLDQPETYPSMTFFVAARVASRPAFIWVFICPPRRDEARVHKQGRYHARRVPISDRKGSLLSPGGSPLPGAIL